MLFRTMRSITRQAFMSISADAFSSLNSSQCSLLNAFVQYGVDFLVVGGYAMRCHGRNRQTNDLDLVVSPSETNLAAIDFAINSLPGTSPVLPSEVLRRTESKLTRFDVEVFASMRGLDYGNMRAAAILVSWAGTSLPVINRDWLKQSKRLAIESPDRLEKREIDSDDLAFLEGSAMSNPSYMDAPTSARN